MRILGSIAIHVLLALVLVSIHHAREESAAPPQIEMIDVAIDQAAPTRPPAPSHTPSGGAPAAHRSARRATTPRTASAGESRVENAELRVETGELRIEPVAGPVGDLAGDGAGGEGTGTGLGLGAGRGLADLLPPTPTVPAPPPAPPAPKISKARPARLIYPSRQTQVDDDRLFVADVTVDSDGFVVGAKLASRSGPRDGEAGALVWRFRYDPALDDDGRPIRSTVHQPFAVAW